jgi:hypothetical protein
MLILLVRNPGALEAETTKTRDIVSIETENPRKIGRTGRIWL